MKDATVSTKAEMIKRDWYLIDLKGKNLGRTAVQIAMLLSGKAKPYFVRNLDCGDFVVITNAKDVTLTGKKETQKSYKRHSGYPGGFKSETVKELRERKPQDIITHAVKGMLPQNRLRDKMLTRLYVFTGETHTYTDKNLVTL